MGLALLVLLVLPSAQIKLGASQLHGLVGSYIAGSHWDVTYSSKGTTTWNVLNAAGTLTPHSQTWLSTGTGDAIDTGGMDATCVGTVTATLTWVHGPGLNNTTDPPPTQVIVTEHGLANYLGGGGNNGPGTLSDGWSADTIPDVPPNNIYGPHYSHGTSGTHVEVKDGTSGTITLSAFSLNATTPSASSFASGNGEVAASVGLSLSNIPQPVTISPDGAVMDTNGKYNILVGQGFSPKMVGMPGVGVTYLWTVSGTTFQSWSPTTPATQTTPANLNASSYVPGSGTLTNIGAHWYWNDSAQTTETVTCAATVTSSDGKTPPYTATVTQKVSVQVPGWTADGTGGYMHVNTHAPNVGGALGLYAGPAPGQAGGGMNWTARSFTPQTPVAFGTGTVELVQLVTPNQSYVTSTGVGVPGGTTHSDPENGQNGLDTGYPYPGPAYSEGSILLPPFATDDSPYLSLDNIMKSATMQHQFTDYLLYLPPGNGNGSQWVPLGTFTWSTNGNATIPSTGLGTGDWGIYVDTYGSDSAGAVSPTATKQFTAGHTFPSWTRINVFPSF